MSSSVYETLVDADVTPPHLIIQLFGRLAVTCAGQPLPKMRSRKEPYLLALLVLHAVDGPIAREWLAATLWPETVESGALYNLRRSLGALRDALGDEAARIVSPTPRTLQLNLDGADCDLRRFDAALRRGDEAAFREAVSLHTSSLLSDCVEEWVFEPRTARIRAMLTALESLAHTAEERSDANSAIEHLRRILDLDPLRETALRSLMTLLVAQGNQAAAADLFRKFRERLVREADAEPDPETLQLNRKILLDTRRANAAAALEAGTMRRSAVLDADYGSTLLQGSDALFGRADAIEAVQVLLKTSRLVTLTGTGGIGKTSLANSVSESVAADYPDGVRFVDLASQSEPELLEQIVGAAVGVTDSAGTSAANALVEFLRSRRMLILLDNCEHLLAACSQLTAQLMADCPDIRILATSREPLHLSGEATWRVPGLALPDSVALFERRAILARPAFLSTSAVRASVEHICQRLDGIPLAIEMAAAWIRAMTAAQIATRLDDAFRLLARTDADPVPRHRTLRATLDWSYSLLTEPERVLLARLAIFAGGWTLEAAEAICPIDDALPAADVLEVLVALVDRSLVVYTEDADGTSRYRFLETTRAYAAERLSEVERPLLQMALTRHLLQLAEAAKGHWNTPEETGWLQRLEVELPNIRVALGSVPTIEAVAKQLDLRLATTLFRFWYRNHHFAEGRRYLLSALNRCRPEEQTETRAAALNASAELARWVRDYAPAMAEHREALTIRRAVGNQRGTAVTLHNLAMTLHQSDDWEGAISTLTECVALYREIGDEDRAEKNQRTLDMIRSRDDTQRAEVAEKIRRDLEVAVQRGDRYAEIELRTTLSLLYLKLGENELARDSLRLMLPLTLENQDLTRLAEALESIAVALASLGSNESLPRLYAAAASLRETIGCPLMQGNREPYERNIAQARLALGDMSFDTHWADGLKLTIAEAVAEAIRG